MEAPLAPPSLAARGALLPPPPDPGSACESHGSADTGPDSAVAVQLASQASHLTLSPSKNALGAHGDKDVMQTLETIFSPAEPTAAADAQVHPEIETEAGEQRWREANVTNTPGEPSVPIAALQSVSEYGLFAGPISDTQTPTDESGAGGLVRVVTQPPTAPKQLLDLPNEVLLQILSNLEVCDLLATSRTSQHLRRLALSPFLRRLRLRQTRAILPPMLSSPSRPSLADLIRRSIFMTHTTVVSRKLARSLVAIRLQRRLAARPSPEALVQRCVLPPECLSYWGSYSVGNARSSRSGVAVAPGLVARKRAIERERVKDELRGWVGSVWRGEVRSREEGVRRWEERVGVGRVWKLRRFWERVSNGQPLPDLS